MQLFFRRWGWELGCFILLSALVGYQIFIPPVTGLANNSDFVYVLGKFQICPADREKQNNIYLVTDYFVDPVSCTWDTGLTTFEVPLVAVATWLSTPFTGSTNFDLRALAAVHMALLLTAFGILLSLTGRAGPAVRYGVPALFILIFSDIAYTGYLNSVYLDAPAYLMLLLTTAVAALVSFQHRSHWRALAYAMAATALVFSKSQHAILGLGFAVLAVVLACRPAKRIFRIEWALIAVLLTGSTLTMLSLTPAHYRVYALYNVVFSRLALHDEKPWEVLDALGLDDRYMKYVDTHAYVPGVPVDKPEWVSQFLSKVSFGKLIWFYLGNPDVMLRELNRDLTVSAPVLRPTDMPNYREKDGYPPRTMATRFSLWSNLRSWALHVFPYHVLLIYLAPWLAWIAGRKWRGLRSALLPLALILSTMGVVVFAMSALTDALDNSRHLFVFQVITEVMIVMIAASLLRLVDQRRGDTKTAVGETQPAVGALVGHDQQL
jgi:hypothetical protein